MSGIKLSDGARVMILTTSDIGRCPKRSTLTGHYRDDRTCRCYPHVDDVDLDQFTERQLRELRVRINRRLTS